jgi:hypothetical protein
MTYQNMGAILEAKVCFCGCRVERGKGQEPEKHGGHKKRRQTYISTGINHAAVSIRPFPLPVH